MNNLSVFFKIFLDGNASEDDDILLETEGTNVILDNDLNIKRKRKNRSLVKLSRLFGISYKSKEHVSNNDTSDIAGKLERLMIENSHLKSKLERVLSCPICNEMVRILKL